MTFNSKKIIDIHEELLKNHKIEAGFKDRELIGSILYRMNAEISNYELYPDVYLKAASLFESIIRLPPFYLRKQADCSWEYTRISFGK